MTTKNYQKYHSYNEAFSRIKRAIENEFYIESICISESIISDRLLSYFNGTGILEIKDEKYLHESKFSLNSLIQKTKSTPQTSHLFSDLDCWRKKRNIFIHKIAKSLPGKPTIRINDFLVQAKETAEQGHLLAREIDKFHKKMKKLEKN